MFRCELLVFIYAVVRFCYVCSMEVPVITRAAYYDLIQFPKCDGPDVNNCASIVNTERFGDSRLCQCKCKSGYVAYRDPFINFISGSYKSVLGKRGCVWHAYYREGCHYLGEAAEITLEIFNQNHTFPIPTVLDLTSSSEKLLTVQDPFKDNGALTVDPYVRIPGENGWEKVDGILFNLNRRQGNKYLLSWRLLKASADIYAYQGLVMKLNFTELNQGNNNCIMTKVAGTYTGGTKCQQRTTNGRCCIFPFVHNGIKYEKCASTPDMPGGTWCAVSLNNSTEEGNHKWRELCPSSSTTRSSLITKPMTTKPMNTKPKSRRFPSVITPHPSSRRPTPKRLTTKPLRTTTPRVTKASVVKPPVAKITVTVTKHTCTESSEVVPTIGARSSGESGGNVGVIVGIVLAILALLLLVALLGLYLRRRKPQGKSHPRKSISTDNLAESPYASVYSMPRQSTKNRVNHGYQQSIELTEDQAAVVRRSYLRDSLNSSSGGNFYDTVETDGSRPGTGLSCPIYSMPEADYSLIEEKSGQTKIENSLPPILPIMLSGTRNNPSSHLYSVLERDNDPLKHPEAIDNDTVFVEANPLYGTTTRRKESFGKRDTDRGIAEANPLYGITTGYKGYKRDKPPPLPPRLYDDPMEIAPTKTDLVGRGEADV